MFQKLALALAAASAATAAVTQQRYSWNNLRIGGGGGFVPNIVFNPTKKGLAYARTDIGGVYRLNADDSWTPLLDFANDATWDQWGSDAIATDAADPNNVYVAAGLYTNSWDPNNGNILKSGDMGKTWTAHQLPFKVGGNMPGRGLGERLAVDPRNNKILFFGARSGNGLWKSTDSGVTWSNVTSFPSVGTYIQSPGDTSGYGSDIMGIAWVTFDSVTKTASGASTIYVGVANMGADNIFVSHDSGVTWASVVGQTNTYIPHKGIFAKAESALYISYANGIGPFDGTDGYVMKYFVANGTWVNITPVVGGGFGYGGLSVDAQKPGTVMVGALNEWYPDANIWRSLDGGATWSDLWESGYPPPNYQLAVTRHYNWDLSRAPWISTFTGTDTKWVGWMLEGLAIDPFDSNHFLYGTGLSLWGSRNLLQWDTSPRANITLASLAVGLEETAVLAITAPTAGPLLVSAVGDIGGFVHNSLTETSATPFTNPATAGTASDVDFAGAAPANIVRLTTLSGGRALATSADGGNTWTAHPAALAQTATGGNIAISASGDTIIWSHGSGFSGAQMSVNSGEFMAVTGLPSGANIKADKQNDKVFYASSGASLYISQDGGMTFTQLSAVLGTASSISTIAANPFTAGDIFVSTNVGIFHSTNFGTSFTQLAGATQAWSLAVGAPAKAKGTPSLFAASIVGGLSTLFRTDDNGANWVRVTDASHGLGSTAGMILAADGRTHGQVFVGTNGRGIFVGHL